jgi:hypothetical protein
MRNEFVDREGGAPSTNRGRSFLASPKPVEMIRPDYILDVAYAFWTSRALLTAVDFDLFTVLAAGALGCDDLVARLGLAGRGARDFFDALVALGFLRRDRDGRYSNEPDADLYLDRRKPTCIAGQLDHLNRRHYRNWSLLGEALRTGSPQSLELGAGYDVLYADDAARQVFLDGMTSGSLLAAKALAQHFPWGNYRTFIDIGTAQGCVPVEIARTHPHLTGGGFDLPRVEVAFASYVRRNGLSNRLSFFPGDFFAESLPLADVLIMGRILHNWDTPTRKLLLRKAYEALPSGGALIVYDPFLDNDRCRDAHALLSSLNMLIETAGGSEYTAEECCAWMQQAGFATIREEPLDRTHRMMVGLKNN